MDETETRRQLFDAARAFVAKEDVETAFGLIDAAKRYGAKPEGSHNKPNNPSGGFVVPFGDSKGQPLSAAPVKELEALAGVLHSSLKDETKAKWANRNRALLLAVQGEITRKGGTI